MMLSILNLILRFAKNTQKCPAKNKIRKVIKKTRKRKQKQHLQWTRELNKKLFKERKGKFQIKVNTFKTQLF